MLVLLRNIGQSIIIGRDSKLTLISINGGQAKIGIDAPSDIQVHREEIYNKIHNTEYKQNKTD